MDRGRDTREKTLTGREGVLQEPNGGVASSPSRGHDGRVSVTALVGEILSGQRSSLGFVRDPGRTGRTREREIVLKDDCMI